VTIQKRKVQAISLKNIHAKILDKILANKIQHYKKKHLIFYNPVGFIPGSQGWFSLCTPINVINHTNERKDKTT